jgi:hypothetical protein
VNEDDDMNKKRSSVFPILAVLLRTIAVAQNDTGVSVHTALLGFAFDGQGKVLRSLTGTSRSASVGAPIDAGATLSLASVSAKQNYALAVLETGGVALIRLDRNPVTIQRLNAAPWPDSIVLSPSGTAAALYYWRAARATVLSGLPDQAAVGWESDLASIAPPRSFSRKFPASGPTSEGLLEPPLALAVSDDGTRLLAGPQTAGLFSAGPDGLVQVDFQGSVAAISYFTGGHTAIVADGQSGNIYSVGDASSPRPALPVAGPVATRGNSAALGVSQDNRHAFLVESGVPGLAVADLTNGAISWTTCDCRPSMLVPLAGDSQFQVTELEVSSMWIADLGSRSIVLVSNALPLGCVTGAPCNLFAKLDAQNPPLTPATKDFNLTFTALIAFQHQIIGNTTQNQALTKLDLTLSLSPSRPGGLVVNPTNPVTYHLVGGLCNALSTACDPSGAATGQYSFADGTYSFSVSVPIHIDGSALDIKSGTATLTTDYGGPASCSASQQQDLLSWSCP